MTRIALTALTLLLSTALSGLANASEKLGLFIGNDDYRYAPKLSNAANDARLIESSARRLGFRSRLLVSGLREEILQEIERVNAGARSGDVVLLYYAGHAVQFGGENYIVPVEARIERPQDLQQVGISFTALFESFDKGGRTFNIIVLDACRDNPFESAFSSERARNLITLRVEKGVEKATEQAALPPSKGLVQPPKVPRNTLIAYATAPGRVALDGDSGNSPFASALSREILSEGLEITSIFRNVALNVKESTRFQQEPWINWSLNGQVILKPRRVDSVSPF